MVLIYGNLSKGWRVHITICSANHYRKVLLPSQHDPLEQQHTIKCVKKEKEELMHAIPGIDGVRVFPTLDLLGVSVSSKGS